MEKASQKKQPFFDTYADLMWLWLAVSTVIIRTLGWNAELPERAVEVTLLVLPWMIALANPTFPIRPVFWIIALVKTFQRLRSGGQRNES